MIDRAAPHDRDRLEAAVRVLRKAGDGAPVVHAPAVLALEVLPEVASRERRRGAEPFVAGGVGVVVVDAEEEGIGRRPRRSAEGADVEHAVVGHALSLCTTSPGVIAASGSVPAPVDPDVGLSLALPVAGYVVGAGPRLVLEVAVHPVVRVPIPPVCSGNPALARSGRGSGPLRGCGGRRGRRRIDDLGLSGVGRRLIVPRRALLFHVATGQRNGGEGEEAPRAGHESVTAKVGAHGVGSGSVLVVRMRTTGRDVREHTKSDAPARGSILPGRPQSSTVRRLGTTVRPKLSGSPATVWASVLLLSSASGRISVAARRKRANVNVLIARVGVRVAVYVAACLTAACTAGVYSEPQPVELYSAPAGVDDGIVYDEYAPPDIHLYPHVFYEGGEAYYANGRWYRHGPRGWGYYRQTPPDLERQRPFVQQAPMAHGPGFAGPPSSTFAPSPTSPGVRPAYPVGHPPPPSRGPRRSRIPAQPHVQHAPTR